MSSMIEVYQKVCKERVNTLLESLFDSPSAELDHIYRVMRYGILPGGKRVRPLLVYGACEALGGVLEQADGAACAVELIHSYSLIHDDLPAMDNDDLRRGQPTTHKAFGEANAILAGDGLQALAFAVLVDPVLNPQLPANKLTMVQVLAQAVGASGMVGGQAIDLESVGRALNQQTLELMHRHKTGALIEASITLGAIASGNAKDEDLANLKAYATAIGLAFQVQDDILDIESDSQTLGKTQGKDMANDKPTYPLLMGMEGAKQYVNELHQQALEALQGYSDSANVLRDLATYIVERRN